MQIFRRAVGQTDAVTVFIELRLRTESITAHRQMIGAHALPAQDFHNLLSADFHIFISAAGSHVEIAAATYQLCAFFHQLVSTQHMSRQEVLCRNIGMVQCVEQRVQLTNTGTHMHGYQAGNVGQQATATGCGSNLNQLRSLRIRATMIAYCNLGADNRWNHHDILFDRTGNGRRRDTVSTGQAVGGNAFFRQCACFSYQVFYASGYTVCTQQAQNSSNTATGNLAQHCFGYAGSRALLTAAAGDMHMHINVTGQQLFAAEIKYLNLRHTFVAFDFISNTHYLICNNQHIFFTKMRRCINVSVSN